MNASTPQPSREDLATRVSVLEEKVDLQHHELALLRQHLDNSIAHSEVRLRDEMHVTVHASEQRIMDQVTELAESTQKREDQHFRWLFGMFVVIFLSNSATILTFVNLLQSR